MSHIKKCFPIHMPITGVKDCQSLNGAIHIRTLDKNLLQVAITYPHQSGSTIQDGVYVNIEGLDKIHLHETTIGMTAKELLLADGLWQDVPEACKLALGYSKLSTNIASQLASITELDQPTIDTVIYDLVSRNMFHCARNLCMQREGKVMTDYLDSATLDNMVSFDKANHIYAFSDIKDLLYQHRQLSEAFY